MDIEDISSVIDGMDPKPRVILSTISRVSEEAVQKHLRRLPIRTICLDEVQVHWWWSCIRLNSEHLINPTKEHTSYLSCFPTWAQFLAQFFSTFEVEIRWSIQMRTLGGEASFPTGKSNTWSLVTFTSGNLCGTSWRQPFQQQITAFALQQWQMKPSKMCRVCTKFLKFHSSLSSALQWV